MKKLLFVLAFSTTAIAATPEAVAPVEPVPTIESLTKERDQLKVQLTETQQVLGVIRQQRDLLASQLLDAQAQLQAKK